MSSVPVVCMLLALMFVPLAHAAPTHQERIVINRATGLQSTELFISDAHGGNEHALVALSGSDYNASFSPNGKWIVFTSEHTGKAEIYRVRPDGSGLEQLTNNRAFDDQGVLSPDGRTLAFVSTRGGGTANIWLLDLRTHHTVNLTRSGSGNFRPSWSPDGVWIAFSSDRDTHAGRFVYPSGMQSWELLQLTAIYIVHTDGNGLRRLTPLNQYSGSPKWSPDGTQIIYYHRAKRDAVPQIVSLDLRTGQQQIRTTGDAWKRSPQFISNSEIGFLEITGETGQRASVSKLGKRSPAANLQSPSWSPDGKSVVYQEYVASMPDLSSAWMVPERSSDSRYALFLNKGTFLPVVSSDGNSLIYSNGSKLRSRELNGSDVRDIFDMKGPPIGEPSLSVNGAQVAFSFGVGSIFHKPNKPTQIAVVHSDGTGMRVLTHGDNNSSYPSFSPDGRYIVYRVFGNEQGLRILSLQDGTITKLTSGWDNFPEWSPRGDLILFTSFRTGDYEIFTIRPDGSGLKQLTHDHGNDAHAVWSPDGRWIAFTSSRTGWKDEELLPGHAGQAYGEIFVMRFDGSDVRQLTDNQWENATSVWLPADESRHAN